MNCQSNGENITSHRPNKQITKHMIKILKSLIHGEKTNESFIPSSTNLRLAQQGPNVVKPSGLESFKNRYQRSNSTMMQNSNLCVPFILLEKEVGQ